MKYNPDIHHRRSIRLKGFDYAQRGAYFVTICTQNRESLFGEIANGDLRLNTAGEMIVKWYLKLCSKFVDIAPRTFIVMPNHFHAIIENVGADPRVRPNNGQETRPNQGEHHPGEHVGSPLHTVVQWFKTMTTNEYIRGVKQNEWKPFEKRLWQRNYYEHIIHNDDEYRRIAEYIVNNPVNWETDKLYEEDVPNE